MVNDRDPQTPAERLLQRNREGIGGIGRPLSERAQQRQRTLEGYFQAGNRPRWMERIGEIDQGIATARRRLEREYRQLREECAGDEARFAARWRERARTWAFDDVNELIHQHNEWFPIERRLPVDPRTGDYVRVNGRSYRRRMLGPDWVLEQFPAG